MRILLVRAVRRLDRPDIAAAAHDVGRSRGAVSVAATGAASSVEDGSSRSGSMIPHCT